MTSFPADLPARTKWPLAILFGVIGGFDVGIALLVFLWPTTSATARNLPVSVVGSEAAVADLKDALAAASPGLLRLVAAEDRDAAVAQIESRETAGAVILTAAPEVLTAPASSLASVSILASAAGYLEVERSAGTEAAPEQGTTEEGITQQGTTDQVMLDQGTPGQAMLDRGTPAQSAPAVTVTEVVPLSETDPYGSGLGGLTLPRLLGGVLGGLVVSLFVAGVIRRLAALLAFGVVAGPVLACVTQAGMGILQGDFLLNAAALSLSLTATASLIAGCSAILGRPGAAFATMSSIFLAVPLSAATAPWQFIAEPWGAIGQFMVPGAANTLLRSLSYFPNAGTTPQWLIIAGWLVIGAALGVIGHYRCAAQVRVPAVTLESRVKDPALV
ncbi:MAG: hypothetical protein ABWY54_08775 [Glaciihabitans sp.]